MKEIILPVSELKEALPGLSKIIGRSRTLPVLQSVRISRGADGKVRLQATDLDSVATYTVKEPQTGAPIEVLLALETLNKTVKGLKAEDTIGLVSEGKDRVKICYTIGGSPVSQSISTLFPDEFPPEPKITRQGSLLEPGFGTAFKQALQCCSQDSSRRIITGACLDVDDKKFHYVVGTNGRTLFSANSFAFNLEKSVIIPDSKFLAWTDLMDDEGCSLAVEPGEEAEPAKGKKPGKNAVAGWVKFESPRWTFITREIEGKFPKWKEVIPPTTGKWTRILLSDGAIKQMLQVIPRLPGDESPNHPVRLRVTSKELFLDGQNKDEKDWTSIPVPDVTITGGPVVTCLNREYLLKALRFNLNQVEIEDALTPLLFSNARRKLVVMPVRLEGDTPPAPAPAKASSPTQEQPTEQTTPQTTAEAQPEERTEMPRTAKAPEAVNRTHPTAEHNNGNGNGNGSVKSVVDHVEQIKESLKGIIRELNTVIDTVRLRSVYAAATNSLELILFARTNEIPQFEPARRLWEGSQADEQLVDRVYRPALRRLNACSKDMIGILYMREYNVTPAAQRTGVKLLQHAATYFEGASRSDPTFARPYNAAGAVVVALLEAELPNALLDRERITKLVAEGEEDFKKALKYSTDSRTLCIIFNNWGNLYYDQARLFLNSAATPEVDKLLDKAKDWLAKGMALPDASASVFLTDIERQCVFDKIHLKDRFSSSSQKQEEADRLLALLAAWQRDYPTKDSLQTITNGSPLVYAVELDPLFIDRLSKLFPVVLTK